MFLIKRIVAINNIFICLFLEKCINCSDYKTTPAARWESIINTMKNLASCLLILFSFVYTPSAGQQRLWQAAGKSYLPAPQYLSFVPKAYLVYKLDEAGLRLKLMALTNTSDEVTIELPMPDGSFRNFLVWSAPAMEAALANKYPEILTFSARAADDARVTAKLDFTLYGFHAMVFDGDNTSLIDPTDKFQDGLYMVHYYKNEVREASKRMICEAPGENVVKKEDADWVAQSTTNMAARTANGWTSRTYRLALAADHQYCQAATGLASPTIAQALSCIVTSINRVNGVYEREFSIHMTLCAKEDSIIWTTNTGGINGTDPFGSINSSGPSCLPVNQSICDSRIGVANYDFGHVFTTGGGGISNVGVVCAAGLKARSCTGLPSPVGDGFDINYVAHEMGHEFGSRHTYNNNTDGSCDSNAVATFAYEPGSGATIMDYAGICGPDDLQMNSDPYFSASALQQIYATLVSTESTCAATATTSNQLVGIPAFTASYTIPYKTPFELLAPAAVDSVQDTATTYCWTEFNLGDFGSRFVNTHLSGPLFRSFQPAYTRLRVFPKMSMVLAGSLSDAGVEGAEGEKAPDTARYLTFKMVYRDILRGNGCFLIPDDSIHLDVIATPAYTGFRVTSQDTAGIAYAGGSTQLVTWDVAGTNAAPINTSSVDIYMSKDGGAVWYYHVGTFPNTGSASVTIPNPPSITGSARFKIKGTGNVFFNVNKTNFNVTNNPSLPVSTGVGDLTVAGTDEVNIYPVPAHDVVHFETSSQVEMRLFVYNSLGQLLWQSTFLKHTEFSKGSSAPGCYYARFINTKTGSTVVKSFVIQ